MKMSNHNTILILDDHLVVRKGIKLFLNDKFKSYVVYESDSYQSTLDLVNRIEFDLIFLDININGIENIKIMKEVKEIQPDVKILVFSSHDEKQYGLRYVQNGADGYLNKFCSEEKMEIAVRQIFEKGYFYSDSLKEKLATTSKSNNNKNPLEKLSNREFEIAKLLVDGEGNLEIANKLDLKMSTVSTYKNRIFEKLKVMSIIGLADVFKENL
jgi:DNA-binding NarL/FixJ family response regulator